MLAILFFCSVIAALDALPLSSSPPPLGLVGFLASGVWGIEERLGGNEMDMSIDGMETILS